jgi:hypothetical protein
MKKLSSTLLILFSTAAAGLSASPAKACGSEVRLFAAAAAERNAWAQACGYVSEQDRAFYDSLRLYVSFDGAGFPDVPIARGMPCVGGLKPANLCEVMSAAGPNCADDVVNTSQTDSRPARDRAYARVRWASKCGIIPPSGDREDENGYNSREWFPSFSGTPDAPIDWNAPCTRQIDHVLICHYGETARF